MRDRSSAGILKSAFARKATGACKCEPTPERNCSNVVTASSVSLRHAANMRAHELRRHSTTAKTFPCNLCDKNFTEMTYVRLHVKTTHSEELAFPCADCEKKFKTKADVKKHAARHAGERAFACGKCDVTCVRLGDLRIHSAACIRTEACRIRAACATGSLPSSGICACISSLTTTIPGIRAPSAGNGFRVATAWSSTRHSHGRGAIRLRLLRREVYSR